MRQGVVLYMYMRSLSWTALEHEHRHPTQDWFWSVGIVAVGGAVLAIIFNDLLFAAVIVVGAFALVLHVLRHPNEVAYEVNERGVRVDNVLYPYATLESFWIHEHKIPNHLVITSEKLFMPHITVPLADVTADEVRDILLDFLPEREVNPSLSEHIMERLGF